MALALVAMVSLPAGGAGAADGPSGWEPPLTAIASAVTTRTVFGSEFEENVKTVVPLEAGKYLAGGYRRNAYGGNDADEIASVWSVADGKGDLVWTAEAGSERSWLQQLWERPDGIGLFFIDGVALNRVNLQVIDGKGRVLRSQAVSRPMAKSHRVLPLTDGGVLVVGQSEENAVNRYGSSAWIERLSPAWQPVFAKIFRGGEQTIPYDAVELKSGDYVLVGRNKRLAATSKEKAWAARLSPAGKIVWQKEFPGDHFERVVLRQDGLLAVVGEAGPRMLVALIAPDGALLDRQLVGEADSSPTYLMKAADDGVVVVGQTYRHFSDKPSTSESFVVGLDKTLRQKGGLVFRGDRCRYVTAIHSIDNAFVLAAHADRPVANPKKEFSLPDVCIMEGRLPSLGKGDGG